MQRLHSGNYVLPDEKFPRTYTSNWVEPASLSSHFKADCTARTIGRSNVNSLVPHFYSQKRTCEMFRNIYRAMVLSRTQSAVTKVANSLSEKTLKDIGYSRFELVRTAVETVTKEFDQADLKRAQAASLAKIAHSPIENASLSLVVVLSSIGPSLQQRLLRG